MPRRRKTTTINAKLDPSPTLSGTQAAEFLGISARTLARWRLDNEGPPFVPVNTRLIVYRLVDLQEWLAGLRHVPPRAYPRDGLPEVTA